MIFSIALISPPACSYLGARAVAQPDPLGSSSAASARSFIVILWLIEFIDQTAIMNSCPFWEKSF